MQRDLQEDGQLPGRPHELLPLLLVPLKLKGDCCNVAVLNASAASVALTRTLPAGADEIIAADSHVTRILNAHIGLPVGSPSLRCQSQGERSTLCLSFCIRCAWQLCDAMQQPVQNKPAAVHNLSFLPSACDLCHHGTLSGCHARIHEPNLGS